MTYCVALSVDRGLVFASDSRTNAGPDQVSVFRKMHVLLEASDRFFVMLSAGNLATTQAVRTRIRHDLEFDRRPNLRTVQSMAEAAEYLGNINLEQRRKHEGKAEADVAMTALRETHEEVGIDPGQVLQTRKPVIAAQAAVVLKQVKRQGQRHGLCQDRQIDARHPAAECQPAEHQRQARPQGRSFLHRTVGGVPTSVMVMVTWAVSVSPSSSVTR